MYKAQHIVIPKNTSTLYDWILWTGINKIIISFANVILWPWATIAMMWFICSWVHPASCIRKTYHLKQVYPFHRYSFAIRETVPQATKLKAPLFLHATAAMCHTASKKIMRTQLHNGLPFLIHFVRHSNLYESLTPPQLSTLKFSTGIYSILTWSFVWW